MQSVGIALVHIKGVLGWARLSGFIQLGCKQSRTERHGGEQVEASLHF